MAKKTEQTPVIQNRKANHLYSVEDSLEVGIMLIGSEVKSIRDGKCNISEAWIDLDEKNGLWLVGAHIDEYLFANQFNHFPARRRKLLAHFHEIQKLRKYKELKGFTLIPLKMYFKNRRVKLELGICKGKNQQDRREDIKKRDAKLEIARCLRNSR